jgi:hypothetical protein
LDFIVRKRTVVRSTDSAFALRLSTDFNRPVLMIEEYA